MDGNGASDLIVGASHLDVSTVDGIQSDAGRIYFLLVALDPKLCQAHSHPLDNISISGSGGYLVDRATGKPEIIPLSLPAGGNEVTYRISTLGDGLPRQFDQRFTLVDQPVAM